MAQLVPIETTRSLDTPILLAVHLSTLQQSPPVMTIRGVDILMNIQRTAPFLYPNDNLSISILMTT